MPNNLPEHPIPKHPQSMSFPVYDTTIFMYTQNNSLNYSLILLRIDSTQEGRQFRTKW